MTKPTPAAVGGKITAAKYNDLITSPWVSDYISYTATMSSLGGGVFSVGTGGSANASTIYRYAAGKVEVKWKFILGTVGFAVPTQPNFTLPVAAQALVHPYQFYQGNGSLFDVSATAMRQAINLAHASSTTVTRIGFFDNVTGLLVDPTATVPWTWAAGDVMQGEFSYIPA